MEVKEWQAWDYKALHLLSVMRFTCTDQKQKRTRSVRVSAYHSLSLSGWQWLTPS